MEKEKKGKGKKENREKELEELLKRVQADFVNYKNRTEEARINLLNQASRDTILKMLPVLDNLERALKHTPKELSKNEWVTGLTHIKNQFENSLKEEGLEIIETSGKEFDHNLHEAISFIEGKGKDGEIVEEYEKGYTLYGQVVRPAKVVVSKISNI
ncbi:nucleotide exchange factor GrpE [bacterium (Candidatus Howlettbacteria) CG_4_10_14_0_8_um_filter_40_9]|nr:MAG: nucleotide exchange factor GrpE [bacterium (Candidatus Howlettbacteria) CG_4_10_14_0_8_um_filter_40_9]